MDGLEVPVVFCLVISVLINQSNAVLETRTGHFRGQ